MPEAYSNQDAQPIVPEKELEQDAKVPELELDLDQVQQLERLKKLFEPQEKKEQSLTQDLKSLQLKQYSTSVYRLHELMPMIISRGPEVLQYIDNKSTKEVLSIFLDSEIKQATFDKTKDLIVKTMKQSSVLNFSADEEIGREKGTISLDIVVGENGVPVRIKIPHLGQIPSGGSSYVDEKTIKAFCTMLDTSLEKLKNKEPKDINHSSFQDIIADSLSIYSNQGIENEDSVTKAKFLLLKEVGAFKEIDKSSNLGKYTEQFTNSPAGSKECQAQKVRTRARSSLKSWSALVLANPEIPENQKQNIIQRSGELFKAAKTPHKIEMTKQTFGETLQGFAQAMEYRKIMDSMMSQVGNQAQEQAPEEALKEALQEAERPPTPTPQQEEIQSPENTEEQESSADSNLMQLLKNALLQGKGQSEQPSQDNESQSKMGQITNPNNQRPAPESGLGNIRSNRTQSPASRTAVAERPATVRPATANPAQQNNATRSI